MLFRSVPVIQNDEYIRQVLSRQTATTGAISTPAGDLALFGPDKNYAFNSDGSFRPSIREIKPAGVTSYPYGTGAMYPGDPGPDIIGKSTNLKVKPQVVVPKANILKGLKDGLKTNPGQLMLTAAVAGAVGAVGWVMSPENTDLRKKEQTLDGNPVTVSSNPDITPFNICFHLPASSTVGKQTILKNGGATYAVTVLKPNPSTGNVSYPSGYNHGSNCTQTWNGYTSSGGWPVAVYRQITTSQIQDSFSPLSAADYDLLDPWFNQQSAEWLGGLIRDVCNGSPNPGACYSGMVDRSKGMISGPALLAGPITTKTTQTPNADGTTTTRTETTKTDFKLTYGKDYFDVETEKKTTVTEDGQLVSETTEKDDTPAQDLADTTPGEEQHPEPEYTFSDSPFPEITPFYDQKYPDGLSGVWNQAKADIDNSSFMRFLSSFIPSFSGSCPTFGLNFAIGNMANFGSVDFQSLCYVFDFVKIILLVTAVFAARQLTFGG